MCGGMLLTAPSTDINLVPAIILHGSSLGSNNGPLIGGDIKCCGGIIFILTNLCQSSQKKADHISQTDRLQLVRCGPAT